MDRMIGAHVSASGGVHKAVDRAVAIGANCLQLFSGSPRVWKRTDLGAHDTDKLFAKSSENNLGPIFTHSLYLVNLASDKPDLLTKSVDALKYDLEFDALIKGSGIAVHLGSHQGRGWEASREQVAEQIRQILADSPDDSTFLIENSAGQNGKLCSNLSEIRWLLDEIDSPRLGWCFDTCHGHAAGYGLGETQPQPATDTKVKPDNLHDQTAWQAIDQLDLWASLKCIHVNDSRDPFASGKDRHENIGHGEIPAEDLEYFLNLEQLTEIPIITEVPGLDGKGPDKPNIDRLKEMCG